MRRILPFLIVAAAPAMFGLQATQSLLAQQSQQHQQQGDAQFRIDVFERFDGNVNLRAPNGSTTAARVVVHNWGIRNGQTVSDFPLQGLLVMELRGGELTTVIDGERTEREADSFWFVPEGASLTLITGNDTAALQVIAIQEANRGDGVRVKEK